MGRAPCCDKENVKRGPWSPEEDSKLKSYIEEHGTGGNWIALPQKIGLKRCGKSCRLRWLNYLRPNIKHGGFSEEEDNLICSLYISIGSRWSIIAAQLPGRTDNDIKNYWNTRLKKKLLGKHRKEHLQQLAAAGSLKQHQDIIKRGLVITNSNNKYSMPAPANINPVAAEDSPYWPELPAAAMPNYSSSPVAEAVVPNQQVAMIPACLNDHASIRKLLIKLGGRFRSDHHRHRQSINDDMCYYSDNIEVAAAVDDDPLFPRSTQQLKIYHDEDESSAASPITASASCPGAGAGGQLFPDHQLNNHYNNNNNQNKILDNSHHEDAVINNIMFQAAGSRGPISTSDYLLPSLHDELIKADMAAVYNNNNICPENKLDGLEFLYSDEDITIMMNRYHTRRPSTDIAASYQTSTSIGWTSGHDDQMQQPLYPPPPPSQEDYDQHQAAGIDIISAPY